MIARSKLGVLGAMFALVGVAAGFGMYSHFGHRRAPHPADDAAAETVRDPDLDRTASLEAAVQRLERTVGMVAADNARAATSPSTPKPEAAEPPSPEEHERQAQARAAEAEILRRARIKQIDEFHASASPNPGWSADVEAQLRRRVSGETFRGISVSGIDCRSATCRVELQADDEGTVGLLGPTVSLLPGFSSSIIDMGSSENETGKRAIAYLAKEGTRFPDP